MMKGRRYQWKCCTCGSTDMEASGTAWWSNASQEWIWEWNDTYCPDCGDLVDVEMDLLPPEVPINSQIL